MATASDDAARWLDPIARATARCRFKVWGFGESIAMEGLLAAGGDHHAFARTLIVDWARGPVVLRDDPLAHVAPGVPLLTLIAETDDRDLWDRAVELATLLANMTPGSAGARIHRPDLSGWEHEVWVDCMHLDGPFLARLGAMAGDGRWTDLAVELLLGHARVLQDETSGLFSHGFDDATGRRNGVHWGRGQGWALLGLVDTLHLLPNDHPRRAEVQQRLDALVAALAATEREPGAWPTVVDRPETYRESSVGAFVALGVGRAIRHRLVPADYLPLADRAWAAVVANLTPEGDLRGVSNATPVGDTVAHYDFRARGVYPWGQGVALLAAVERRHRQPDVTT
jgi:rhamnogalacturonyl hydrolase YesR